MFLGEANDLLTPYLQHPRFAELRAKNPRIEELIGQIQVALQNVDEKFYLGIRCVKLDEETEKALREFAEICERELK